MGNIEVSTIQSEFVSQAVEDRTTLVEVTFHATEHGRRQMLNMTEKLELRKAPTSGLSQLRHGCPEIETRIKYRNLTEVRAMWMADAVVPNLARR